MGLLDVLNGMQNGPRGQRDPTASSQGMSPLTMAVLGLLAYKAFKSFTGNQPSCRDGWHSTWHSACLTARRTHKCRYFGRRPW